MVSKLGAEKAGRVLVGMHDTVARLLMSDQGPAAIAAFSMRDASPDQLGRQVVEQTCKAVLEHEGPVQAMLMVAGALAASVMRLRRAERHRARPGVAARDGRQPAGHHAQPHPSRRRTEGAVMATSINCSSYRNPGRCAHPTLARRWFGDMPHCVIWLDARGQPQEDPRRPRGECGLCTPLLRPALVQPMPFPA
jgi:hypothetical protein